jgi:hypothetical protein
MKPIKWTAFLLTALAAQAQTENADRFAQLQNLAIKNKLNLEMAAVQAELSSAQFGLVGGIVQGAPYMADVTTESVQVLGDGTRLRHQTAFSVARDGAGRIARLENGQTVFVLDPVANVSYNIDHQQKTVQQMPLARAPQDNWVGMGNGFEMFTKNPGSPSIVRAIEFEGLKLVMAADVLRRFKERGAGLAVESVCDPAKCLRAAELVRELLAERGYKDAKVEVRFENMTASAVRIVFVVKDAASDASGKTETLGHRTIEGVTADGTRVTTTIPVDTIGNDRPIQVVSERWYSPELQVNLKTERRDPRTGDVVFQLTNLRRGEPARALFEVPAGYSVKALVKKKL